MLAHQIPCVVGINDSAADDTMTVTVPMPAFVAQQRWETGITYNEIQQMMTNRNNVVILIIKNKQRGVSTVSNQAVL